MNACQLRGSTAASAVVNANPAFALSVNFNGRGAAFKLRFHVPDGHLGEPPGADEANAAIQALPALKLQQDKRNAPNQ